MRHKSLLACVAAISPLVLLGAGTAPETSSGLAEAERDRQFVVDRRVHTVGDVITKIQSDACFGGRDTAQTAEPDSIRQLDVSFVYPAKNGSDYLYKGGLWVGGILNIDTLVMAAISVRSSTNATFRSSEPIQISHNASLWRQDFQVEYTDTLTPPSTSGAPQVMGLEIRQVSRQFASRPYDRFITVEYLIRNVSNQTIKGTHIGFFADADAAIPEDDVSGFLRDCGIAYTFDYDGDPWPSSSDSIRHLGTPAVFGIAPISMDPQPCCTTFNWWAPNRNGVWWGPGRPLNDTRAPATQQEMYRAMSNGEVDYDQIDAGADHSDLGWGEPLSDSVADDVANGLDTRWLIAYAFGDLQSHDSIRLVMALAIGDSAHSVTQTSAPSSQPDAFSTAGEYRDLMRNVSLARAAWNDQSTLPNSAPPHVYVVATGDHSVSITWTPTPSPFSEGYRVWRRTVSEDQWDTVATVGVATLEWTDVNLDAGGIYEYAVSTIGMGGQESVRSRSAKVPVGFPRNAPAITCKNTPSDVSIGWLRPHEDSGEARYDWINIYRRVEDPIYVAPSSKTFHFKLSRTSGQPILEVGSAGNDGGVSFGMNRFRFVDDEVFAGYTYAYRATFTNALGVEGPASTWARVTPMRMNFPGIVIEHTLGSRRMLVNPDTLTAFYSAWASANGFQYSNNGAFPPITNLSHSQCVVLIMEDISASFPDGLALKSMETYLASGGKVVLIARNHLPVPTTEQPNSPHPLLRRFLGVLGTTAEVSHRLNVFPYKPPFTYIAAGFTRASSVSDNYQDIDGDSVLAWSDIDWTNWAANVDSVYGAGFVPAIGCLDSVGADTEVLYRYVSAYDTSYFHNKPIAVKRITDSTGAILFNFPLSIMNHEQAWRALSQAVIDLGVNISAYARPSQSSTQRIIDWLFGPQRGNAETSWDINRDGAIDIRDVVTGLNRPNH